MSKPKPQDHDSWKAFKSYCENEGINLQYEEDWKMWWDCWVEAYDLGYDDGRIFQEDITRIVMGLRRPRVVVEKDNDDDHSYHYNADEDNDD